MDTEIYCICRKPAGYNRYMIECDKCKEWFHGSCVGVKKSAEPVNWFCPHCKVNDGMPVQNQDSAMEIEFQEFKNSVTADCRSNKEDITSVSSEVQSLKTKVTNLMIVVQSLTKQKLHQEQMDKKEKELNEMHDMKIKCLDEEWKEKVRKVEIECAKQINDLKRDCEIKMNEMREKYDLKCKELVEMDEERKKHAVEITELKKSLGRKCSELKEMKKMSAEKERQSPISSTFKTPITQRKSLSLNKRPLAKSQPCKMDSYDEMDADFKIPPK